MQQRDTSDGSARMEMFSWVAGGGDWTEKMQIDDIMLQRERVKKKNLKKEYGVVCHWSKGGRSRRAKREGAALVFLCH